MNILLSTIIVIYLTFTNNLNKILMFGMHAVSTKIIFDDRSINVLIKDILLQNKLKKKIKLNKNNLSKTRIIIFVYKNNIFLIGEGYNIKNIINIENIIKDNTKNKKIFIINNLLCKKSINNNQILKDIFLSINIYFKLIFNKKITLSNFKIFVENNKIFIIILKNKKNKLQINNLLKIYKNNLKIFLIKE